MMGLEKGAVVTLVEERVVVCWASCTMRSTTASHKTGTLRRGTVGGTCWVVVVVVAVVVAAVVVAAVVVAAVVVAAVPASVAASALCLVVFLLLGLARLWVGGGSNKPNDEVNDGSTLIVFNRRSFVYHLTLNLEVTRSGASSIA